MGRSNSTKIASKAARCPYCGKFFRGLWVETDHYGSSWYWQTGQVDGKLVCEHCGREM
jgi:hypothetical protein